MQGKLTKYLIFLIPVIIVLIILISAFKSAFNSEIKSEYNLKDGEAVVYTDQQFDITKYASNDAKILSAVSYYNGRTQEISCVQTFKIPSESQSILITYEDHGEQHQLKLKVVDP